MRYYCKELWLVSIAVFTQTLKLMKKWYGVLDNTYNLLPLVPKESIPPLEETTPLNLKPVSGFPAFIDIALIQFGCIFQYNFALFVWLAWVFKVLELYLNKQGGLLYIARKTPCVCVCVCVLDVICLDRRDCFNISFICVWTDMHLWRCVGLSLDALAPYLQVAEAFCCSERTSRQDEVRLSWRHTRSQPCGRRHSHSSVTIATDHMWL